MSSAATSASKMAPVTSGTVVSVLPDTPVSVVRAAPPVSTSADTAKTKTDTKAAGGALGWASRVARELLLVDSTPTDSDSNGEADSSSSDPRHKPHDGTYLADHLFVNARTYHLRNSMSAFQRIRSVAQLLSSKGRTGMVLDRRLPLLVADLLHTQDDFTVQEHRVCPLRRQAESKEAPRHLCTASCSDRQWITWVSWYQVEDMDERGSGTRSPAEHGSDLQESEVRSQPNMHPHHALDSDLDEPWISL